MMNPTEAYPVQQIREQFPALQRTYHHRSAVYFDGPGGSQAVKSSIDAIAAYMSNGGANLHGPFPTSIETEQMIHHAKQAIADLLGSSAEEVAFGANMTTLTFAIARALGRNWKQGDEIVVTELDHRANVDPWLTVAEDKGMTVRWLKVNPDTLTLDLSDLNSVITANTKLVAVGLASNAVGTINDVATIAKHAKQLGALVAVDAVHAAPHLFIDRDQLGADILLCSVYKFFGPHIGIAVIRKGLFESLSPYKILPAPTYIPDKLETGTQNHEGIAGIVPAIEFIASLAVHGDNRRERIHSGFAQIEAHENRLAEKIRSNLAQINRIKLFQADPDVPKTPTIAFRVEGISPQQFCRRMCEDHSIFIADGDFYAVTLASKLGILDSGGWIRAGLAPYNSQEEVERFINGVHSIING